MKIKRHCIHETSETYRSVRLSKVCDFAGRPFSFRGVLVHHTALERPCTDVHRLNHYIDKNLFDFIAAMIHWHSISYRNDCEPLRFRVAVMSSIAPWKSTERLLENIAPFLDPAIKRSLDKKCGCFISNSTRVRGELA